MTWYFVSFADAERGHLGCCEVEAEYPLGAVGRAAELGINPGGQAAIFATAEPELPEQNRLYTKGEMHELGHETINEIEKRKRST